MITKNWLQYRTELTPDHPAILHEGRITTYTELLSMSRKFAYWLSKNVQSGTKIAIFLKNSPEMIALIHACSMVNCELVLINARLTAPEIKWQLEFLETDVLISSVDFGHVLRDLDTKIYVISGFGVYDTIKLTDEIEDIMPITAENILCYVFTSGTTGRPKAVPLTYANFYSSATASEERLGIDPDDIWLLTIPLYHLGGLSIVFRSVISGISINLHARFNEEAVMKDLEDNKITVMSLVPVMLKRLLPHFTTLASLRLILVGGAPAPIGLLFQVFELELPIATTYGLTESCSQFATALPGQVKTKPESVGKPLNGGDVKIFRPDLNGIGEIGIKGPMVTSGYVNVDNQPMEDGYLLTGDLGYVDEMGNLFIKQRRTDLIIAGGENIYPSEIEAALSELPEFQEVCVIGVEDQIWGQIPIGIAVLKRPITAMQIDKYLGNQLARYKIPKFWYSIQELPRTSSGKIIRSKLKELYDKGLEEIPYQVE